MMNKKAFEFSFPWLFAIIVGAVIIFLAIYASTKLIKTQRTIQDTELGKELGIILNPIETSFETGKAQKISFPFQTRIFNECKTLSTFGSQKISTATKSGIGEEWQAPGEQSTFYNKYLFSENVIEGKDHTIFSKPFEMPFKIANLIYIWPETDKYCFINPPGAMEDEINDLKLKGFSIASKQSECPIETKRVCFTSTGCDIDITLDVSGKIRGTAKKKNSDRVYFESQALLYGAIFADSKTYECQVTRLMKRTSELSWLYYSKTSFLSSKGCSSNLEADLLSFANQTFSINSSSQLRNIAFDSENIGRKNNELNCQLF